MYVILFQNFPLSPYDQLIMFIGFPEWDIPAADPMNYENDIKYTIGDFTNTNSGLQMRGMRNINIHTFA